LLPFVIASVIDGTVLEQAQEMIRDGQPKGSSSPAEGGNLLANLIDIKKGFLKLDQDDQTILRLRYHENFTLQQIAQVLECAVSTADRRCEKSLRRLQDNLGGVSPWQ
jgi:RNA polymerase sigma factor (sigma-70 family)